MAAITTGEKGRGTVSRKLGSGGDALVGGGGVVNPIHRLIRL